MYYKCLSLGLVNYTYYIAVLRSIILFSVLSSSICWAQNPLINSQFTADPSARVFNGKVYLFPSHDIAPETNPNREKWFSMADYHVFSSENLTDWEDHGMIVSQNKVPWVKENSFSMWAPDCIERNGKYYFYFPSTQEDADTEESFTVGVAIADQPEGPYTPQVEPIVGVQGIDPNVFIDDDGQAYLYWSGKAVYGAKLKENMLELASEPVTFHELPQKGHKEGPYMFKRAGIYYLTYPHVANKTERLEYAIGNSPLGPFKVTGVIMDESPSGCWTNHHSIIDFKDQYYLFYHDNDYSPGFDKNRSVRIDSLHFNDDGTIQQVKPTRRGVGITLATKPIQIDRYSEASTEGVAISFLDEKNTFLGWKSVLEKKDAFIRYSRVAFESGGLASAVLRVHTQSRGKIEVRAGGLQGALLAAFSLQESDGWKEIKTKLEADPSGVHDLYIVSDTDNKIEIDWLTFQ